MKSVKFMVGGSALVAAIAVFLKWVSVQGQLAPDLKAMVPLSGMDNGGPLFLFFLALPAICALVGLAKRFGRGLAIGALVGSLLATLLGLVKLGDISHAGEQLGALGGKLTVEAAGGYWIFLAACAACLVSSVLAIIKPEPKPALRQPLAAMA